MHSGLNNCRYISFLLQDTKKKTQDQKCQADPQEQEDKSAWKITHQEEETMSKGQKKKQKKREKCEEHKIHFHFCFQPIIVLSVHLIDLCKEK